MQLTYHFSITGRYARRREKSPRKREAVRPGDERSYAISAFTCQSPASADSEATTSARDIRCHASLIILYTPSFAISFRFRASRQDADELPTPSFLRLNLLKLTAQDECFYYYYLAGQSIEI